MPLLGLKECLFPCSMDQASLALMFLAGLPSTCASAVNCSHTVR